MINNLIDKVLNYFGSESKFKLLMFGGLLVVAASIIAVYFNTGSTDEVIKVLKLQSFPRVGMNIPFGYLFIAIGAIGYSLQFFLKKLKK